MKTKWSLMPWSELAHAAEALTFGAEKHDDPNGEKWKEAGLATISNWESSVMRHWVEHQKGQMLDPESGLPHLAHMIAKLLFLMWHSPIQVDVDMSALRDNEPIDLVPKHAKNPFDDEPTLNTSIPSKHPSLTTDHDGLNVRRATAPVLHIDG